MKKFLIAFYSVMLVLGLSACMASTSSPVGISCDATPGKLIWEMPLVCQGR